jgi:hypothetical protein
MYITKGLIKNRFKNNFNSCLALLITFLASSFSFQSVTEDGYIQWSSDKTLKREDFRGKIIHKNAVASTVYCIHKEIIETNDGLLYVSVKTYFLSNNSWMLKDSDGKDVIEHEQNTLILPKCSR